MSLISQISALATRIAQEFNTVRTEIESIPTGFGDVDGGSANAYYGWQDAKIDGGNASTVFLDGVYLDGGKV